MNIKTIDKKLPTGKNPVGNDSEPLNPQEIKELKRCEKIINSGKQAFLETGEALAIINDQRLYRATHKTFAEYCPDAHGISAKHAYGFINSFKVAQEAFAAADKAQIRPNKMSQLLALKGLAPDKMNEVMRIALKKAKAAGRSMTAHDLHQARQEVEGAGGAGGDDNGGVRATPAPEAERVPIVDPHDILHWVHTAQRQLSNGETTDAQIILDRIRSAIAAWISSMETAAQQAINT